MSRKTTERYAALRQSWWRHRDVVGMSRAAAGVYALGLSYCADDMSDGFIPRATAVKMLADGQVKLIAELIEAGMWSEVEGGYEVTGYLEHNISKDQLNELIAKRRRAGKAGGKAKAKADAKASAVASATASEKQNGSKPLPDLDLELTPLPPNGGEEGERPDLGTQVSHLLASGPETPAAAWRLIEMLADLECQPCGAPWIRLGMASQADLRRMTEILDRAREIAPQDPPLRTVAVEWTALIGLIASGQQEHPKAPVPYFRQGFGTFEQRHEVAA